MLGTFAYDIRNLINNNYFLSKAKEKLESLFSGQAIDHSKPYSKEELSKLDTDTHHIFQQVMQDHPVKKKLVIVTAGAPGAGKTVLLNQIRKKQKKSYAYICPDDVCLKNQTETYQSEIEKSPTRSRASRQNAYTKWRPSSIAITHLILDFLIQEGYAFNYGSTSSTPTAPELFAFLKEKGYQIKLIHVSASNAVRRNSIQERDQTFVQTTDQDIKEKGDLLPQRINDTFLRYADKIKFYYRDAVNEDAQLAAIWLRKKIIEDQTSHNGTLQVINQEAYKEIKKIHNDTVKALDRLELSWENSVEHLSQFLF